MRLLAEEQIQEYFTSRTPFPDMGDNTAATPHVTGIIAKGIQSFLPCNEHSSLIMELLADNDETGLAEQFLRPDY